MRARCLLAALLVVGCFVPVSSTPTRSADVARLTAEADLIVAGRVIAVIQHERTAVALASGSVSASRFSASLRAERPLKGDLSTRDVSFYFLLPDAPIGFQGVVVGQYGVFFLKTSQGRWEFVDPAHPALPALPDSQLPTGTPLDQVTATLGQVLVSPRVSDADFFLVLDALSQLQTDLARELLQQASQSTFGQQQLTIAGALVAHNDITGLELVATALLHPAGLSADMLQKLPAALSGLKDPKAIPTLARLVKANNPDINRFAAAALRQTGSVEALLPLSQLLDDNDLTTQYYAVVGLGEISRQDDWTPAFEEFQLQRQRYLAYWRRWAMENLR